MIDIETEFNRAIRFVKRSGVQFPLSNHVQWGCAPVAFFGMERQFYEPMDGGKVMAFIAPVVEDGELIDLCAIDQNTNHFGTRLGLGHGLGIDTIAQARWGDIELRLVATAMAWLMEPRDSLFLFNLRLLPTVLDGVDVIACETIELGQRVAALLPPSQRDRVQVA